MDKYESLLKESQTQKYMHLIDDEREDPELSKKISTVHFRGKTKTLWYRKVYQKMEVNTSGNDGVYSYRTKTYPYSALFSSKLFTKTPKISLKEEHSNLEFRWVDNLFINAIDNYSLELNDYPLQPQISGKYLHFRKNITNNDYEIGNRESLITWSKAFDRENISIELDWPYNRSSSDAFPLKYLGQDDRLIHIIKYNLELDKLILVRNSEGEYIDFDIDYFNVEGNMTGIFVPELEGVYTEATKDECEKISCIGDKMKTGMREIYLTCARYVEDINETNLGSNSNIPIDLDEPVNEIYWGAQNLSESILKKDLILTSYDKSPIEKTSIKTSVDYILHDTISYKTERTYPFDDFNIQGREGFNYYKSNVCEENCKKFTPGYIMKGGKIEISTISKKTSEKFRGIGILVYTRRILLEDYPKTQKERIQKKTIIYQ